MSWTKVHHTDGRSVPTHGRYISQYLVARAICNAIRANRFTRLDLRESFAIETPIFIARQADSHESLEFPIRANRVIRANRANRFARIAPLSLI